MKKISALAFGHIYPQKNPQKSILKSVLGKPSAKVRKKKESILYQEPKSMGAPMQRGLGAHFAPAPEPPLHGALFVDLISAQIFLLNIAQFYPTQPIPWAI